MIFLVRLGKLGRADGATLDLTTPVQNDIDALFPGEEWFLYWKTSSSLWREKLSEKHLGSRVILPLYWGLHSENGEDVDFGEHRPETDLSRLCREIESLGKEVIFLVPLGPAPFLPGGGVPSLLSRHQSVGEDGLLYTVLDSEEIFIKIYSFYDPRVFQGLSKFVKKLAQYISEKGITASIYSVDYGVLKGEKFHSYRFDHSHVYQQAFSRFLEAKKEEGLEIKSVEEEKKFHQEFRMTVLNLYRDTLRRSLSPNYIKELKCVFLGGDTRDSFSRMFDHYFDRYFSEQIHTANKKNLLLSSALIPSRRKSELITRQLTDVMVEGIHNDVFEGEVFERQASTQLFPLRLFRIFCLNGMGLDKTPWHQSGLLSYLDEKYSWPYKIEDLVSFAPNDDEETEYLCFFNGNELEDHSFRRILKYFMGGGKIVLNTNGLGEKLARRLESFQVENSLKTETVRLGMTIKNINLGEGRIILYDSKEQHQISDSKMRDIWEKIISTFPLKGIKIESEDGVLVYWRYKGVGPGELNFEQIRRLSIYNPTSYKKKVKVFFEKNFALVKVLDEKNSKVQSTPHELVVQMLPSGAVSLDFGLYS